MSLNQSMLNIRKNNSTKMDLTGIWCEFLDWIQLAQERVQQWDLAKEVKNLQVP
jgi:hypothetical protein